MTGTRDTSAPSFGVLLRRYREAAGLSQEELAERAGVSGQAISALERGERRHPYPATVRQLAEALGLPEEEQGALLAAVPARRQARPDAASGGTRRPSAQSGDQPRAASGIPALPTPLTALLGRDDDVARVTELLQDGVRLLTLTGPGGVGKTRLILQIATEMRRHFPDGVAFVSLAHLADPSLVLPTMAQVLGVRDTGGKPLDEQLAHALEGRRLLLVLDNCEHILEGVGAIAALLEACPRLVVLATSRASLRLQGEQEYPVSPLALPHFDHSPTIDEVEAAPAVRLFVERAQAARSGFALTADNVSAVAAICGRLDGLPLALELAAPRIKILSPSALLARLHHALPLLTGGGWDAPARQQTLHDTIAWSYGLLEEEQVLFRRLSVFVGGCTLEAAEAVCAVSHGGDGDVLEGLGSLVDKSLLQVQDRDGNEPRFAMLETIQEFAQAELEAVEERDAIRERHARYFLELAEAGLVPLHTLPADYLPRLETEQDNLRVAMDWAREKGEAELGLRLVWAHYTFWVVKGHCTEGQQRAEELLAIDRPVDPRLRSRTLVVAGSMARLRGDLTRALELLDQALTLARETGDSIRIAFACQQGGLAAQLAGDPERARVLLDESLARASEANTVHEIAISTHLLAGLALLEGELDQAGTLWEESLSLFRETGDQSQMAMMLTNLALVAVLQGGLERGKTLLLECLPLAVQVGYAIVTISFLELMAAVAVGEEEPADAARFLGAAEVARGAAGEALEPVERATQEQTMETGRAQIGAPGWNRAYQEGRELPFEEALTLAREYAVPHHRDEGADTGLR
jgi:predicted ATPase/transcriptional regulator with XRE-family HTH domain